MEWADGGDLDSVIQRHVKAKEYMSEDQLLGYFVQLLAALAHVHQIGIMHRDIKTNNVFMTSQGLLKLGDFGISKVRCLSNSRSSSSVRG
jgi:NIMA (never in mitosis gene a)-related kinase